MVGQDTSQNHRCNRSNKNHQAQPKGPILDCISVVLENRVPVFWGVYELLRELDHTVVVEGELPRADLATSSALGVSMTNSRNLCKLAFLSDRNFLVGSWYAPGERSEMTRLVIPEH